MCVSDSPACHQAEPAEQAVNVILRLKHCTKEREGRDDINGPCLNLEQMN